MNSRNRKRFISTSRWVWQRSRTVNSSVLPLWRGWPHPILPRWKCSRLRHRDPISWDLASVFLDGDFELFFSFGGSRDRKNTVHRNRDRQKAFGSSVISTSRWVWQRSRTVNSSVLPLWRGWPHPILPRWKCSRLRHRDPISWDLASVFLDGDFELFFSFGGSRDRKNTVHRNRDRQKAFGSSVISYPGDEGSRGSVLPGPKNPYPISDENIRFTGSPDNGCECVERKYFYLSPK